MGRENREGGREERGGGRERGRKREGEEEREKGLKHSVNNTIGHTPFNGIIDSS